jgi:glycosyltransferase involved in cell wall biosynthesis
MKIHVITVLRNEEKILPWYLRHYASFADAIWIADDNSDDATELLVRQCPKARYGKFSATMLDDEAFASFYSGAVKFARFKDADWVICVDADEFVYHQWLIGRLEEAKQQGLQVIDTEGWNMLSEQFPTTTGQIYEEVTEGVRDDFQSKPCIVAPGVEIRFEPGRHNANVNGAKRGSVGIKQLHFRFLGKEYFIGRHAKNAARITASGRARGYGAHNMPGWNGMYSEKWYDDAMKIKQKVV